MAGFSLFSQFFGFFCLCAPNIYKAFPPCYNEITQGGVFMWEISEVKERARSVLSRFGYWMPFLATIIVGFFATNPANIVSILTEDLDTASILENEEYLSFLTAFIPLLLIFSFVWNTFIGYPLMVGMNRFFMENRLFGSKIESLFWVFKSGGYLNIVKTMFLLNLKVLLWSFLFIIPGIIKSYEYFMVPYILAENPKISSKRAFELSKEMTRDEKFDIFLLGLSFIGWIILGSITCGIGLLFLEPYVQATYAELYQVEREKVHSRNISDFEELPGFLRE